jgi:predicted nucleic acid-binding protein
MVLIDTSVWIDHLNRSDPLLQFLLNEYEVVTHSYILGELACGNFKNRTRYSAYYQIYHVLR